MLPFRAKLDKASKVSLIQVNRPTCLGHTFRKEEGFRVRSKVVSRLPCCRGILEMKAPLLFRVINTAHVHTSSFDGARAS